MRTPLCKKESASPIDVPTHPCPGNVHMAIQHCHHPQVLLVDALPPGGHLGHGPDRGALAGLPAGVGVHLVVHHEDVDVAVALGQHVVQSTEADVVGPAVVGRRLSGGGEKIPRGKKIMQNKYPGLVNSLH